MSLSNSVSAADKASVGRFIDEIVEEFAHYCAETPEGTETALLNLRRNFIISRARDWDGPVQLWPAELAKVENTTAEMQRRILCRAAEIVREGGAL